MKKILLYLVVLMMITISLYSCAGMSVGMGFGVSTGPYGPVMAPSFNVGFGGGYYW